MSDMTVVQLVVAQRERELRALRRWGPLDVVVLPVASLLLAIAVAWLLVAGPVAVGLRLVRKPTRAAPADGQTGHT